MNLAGGASRPPFATALLCFLNVHMSPFKDVCFSGARQLPAPALPPPCEAARPAHCLRKLLGGRVLLEGSRVAGGAHLYVLRSGAHFLSKGWPETGVRHFLGVPPAPASLPDAEDGDRCPVPAGDQSSPSPRGGRSQPQGQVLAGFCKGGHGQVASYTGPRS